MVSLSVRNGNYQPFSVFTIKTEGVDRRNDMEFLIFRVLKSWASSFQLPNLILNRCSFTATFGSSSETCSINKGSLTTMSSTGTCSSSEAPAQTLPRARTPMARSANRTGTNAHLPLPCRVELVCPAEPSRAPVRRPPRWRWWRRDQCNRWHRQMYRSAEANLQSWTDLKDFGINFSPNIFSL